MYHIWMNKILLVEDDADLARTIRTWLESERYQVTHTTDGSDGFSLLKGGGYELAILDWELPGMTGVEISRKYRINKGEIPILMLTGKEMVADRIEGLDAGADDYLTKPFSLKELSARIRALLRRPAAVSSNILEVGPFSLDPKKYRVTKNGVELRLMPREFALFEFLMKNPDVVFSADALLQRVWEDDSDASSDALRTSVRRLRKVLDEQEDESQSIIENIPRVGYRLRVPKA